MLSLKDLVLAVLLCLSCVCSLESLTVTHMFFNVKDPLNKWVCLPLSYRLLFHPPSAVLILYSSEVLAGFSHNDLVEMNRSLNTKFVI